MKKTKRAKRPAFDRELGLEIARTLFHARGYDAVSIADLTKALNVNPPSLYAAYGSKLELFERVLRNYVATDFLPVEDILSPDLKPADAITNLLVAAARHYTANPERPGCLVTEALRADSAEAAALATQLAAPSCEVIRKYIAAHAAPDDVDRILDYVLVNLRGLSSFACLHYSADKLVECSKIAGRALEAEFR